MHTGIRKTMTILLVFLSVWLGLRYLLPLISPFLLGTALALAAEPMVTFLHKRIRVPRSISAGIGVSMAFCFLAMVLLLICAFLVRELGALAGILPDLENAVQSGASALQAWLLNLTAHTPPSIQPLLSENIGALFSDGAALMDKAIRFALGLAGNLLSHIPDSALGLGTAVISGFMISAKLPKIRFWISRRISIERLRPVLAAGKRMKDAAFGWLLAQCKLMGLTFSILALGFLLLRIPHALLWALGVSVVDAFPVLGTGTILLPWALICFLQEDGARAVGLLGIYAVISLTRSALEPRLVGRHLGLDPLVTLMALYAGYKLWGIGGMILAPLLAVTALQIAPEKE